MAHHAREAEVIDTGSLQRRWITYIIGIYILTMGISLAIRAGILILRNRTVISLTHQSPLRHNRMTCTGCSTTARSIPRADALSGARNASIRGCLEDALPAAGIELEVAMAHPNF